MARRLKDERVADSHTFKAKLLDYMEREDISNAEMARRIKVKPMTLSKWFSEPSRQPSVPAVINAAYEMGENRAVLLREAGYPIDSPPPSDYRERTERILDRVPHAEHVIHRLGLLDPAWQTDTLAALEAMIEARLNGLVSHPSPE